jgi:laminin, beta 1
MQGRACSEPKQNYFIPNLHNVYEAEHHFTICDSHSSYGNCTIVLKEPYHDRVQTWTGPGYQRVYEGTDLEFNIDNIPKTMNYDVIIRYQTQMKGDWEDARITVVRPDLYDPEGACANSHPAHETNRPIFLPEYDNQKLALQDVCLESGKIYKIRVSFTRHNSYEENPAAQILIDSVGMLVRCDFEC